MTEQTAPALAVPVTAGSEPVQGRTLVGSFVRWAVTGALAASADLGLLALLHSALGVQLEVATVIAFCVGMAINYSLNHSWSFQTTASHRRVVVRYAAVVVFNAVSTVLIVAGLHRAGVYYLLAKLIAIAVNAVVNFATARWWIFAND